MNNLQLFKMYRRFTDREIANFRWLMNAPSDELFKFWDDWRKWEGLAKRAYTEMEKRLTVKEYSYADEIRQDNEEVRYWASLGLFSPD